MACPLSTAGSEVKREQCQQLVIFASQGVMSTAVIRFLILPVYFPKGTGKG